MLGNQEFNNALQLLQAARKDRLEGNIPSALKREGWADKAYKKMDGSQKGAFELFEVSERTEEDRQEARELALGPLGQLTSDN